MITPEQLARSGSEDGAQSALFAWCAISLPAYPQLEWFYHIPNGGMRSAKEGARMKKLGAKRGVLDCCLPVGKRGYNALYIEMKTKIGIVSPDQERWILGLTNCGNLAIVAYSWEEARDILIWYLSP